MDQSTFIAHIVQSVAWPVTVLALLLIFRRPIVTLINNIAELEVFGGKVKIGHDIAKAATRADAAVAELRSETPGVVARRPTAKDRNPYLDELDSSPALAAIHAWSGLEESLRALAHKGGITIPRGMTITQLLGKMADARLVNRGFATATSELRAIRNKIAHGRTDLGYAEGLAFVNSAWELQRAADLIAAMR